MNERMTVEELEQLLKENPDGVEFVCDDKFFNGKHRYDLYRIRVERMSDDQLVIINSNLRYDIVGTDILKHYPSQKKKDEIVELRQGHDGYHYTLDYGNYLDRYGNLIQYSTDMDFHPDDKIRKFNLTTKKWVL